VIAGGELGDSAGRRKHQNVDGRARFASLQEVARTVCDTEAATAVTAHHSGA
jgi:hypothetical protein